MNVGLKSAMSVGVVCASAMIADAVQVIVPDNGSGTAQMPPVAGTYVTPIGDMHIIDGLPPSTTVDVDATLGNFFYNPFSSVYSFAGMQNQAGGMLGGWKWASDGTLQMPMIGTGALLGFNRNIPMPVSFEIHSAPTMAYAPVQTFNAVMFRGFGQILGDPDFDLLRVIFGNDFGLPSPGVTTLTQVGGGNWNVDSFFDITYRIDFVGRPGGSFSGLSGSTNGVARFQLGEPIPAPGVLTLLGLGGVVAMRRRRSV